MIEVASNVSFSKPVLRIPVIVRKSMFLAGFLSLIMILASVSYYIVAQPQLPIFFSLARANQQLAAKEWLFLFPTLSILINLIHIIVFSLFKDYEEIILRLLGFFTIVIQVVMLLALLRIIYITF